MTNRAVDLDILLYSSTICPFLCLYPLLTSRAQTVQIPVVILQCNIDFNISDVRVPRMFLVSTIYHCKQREGSVPEQLVVNNTGTTSQAQSTRFTLTLKLHVNANGMWLHRQQLHNSLPLGLIVSSKNVKINPSLVGLISSHCE